MIVLYLLKDLQLYLFFYLNLNLNPFVFSQHLMNMKEDFIFFWLYFILLEYGKLNQ